MTVMDNLPSPWVQTASGRAWDLLAPKARDVDWGDVAHQLARIGRFCGSAHGFVSIAAHSLTVADLVPGEARAHALLHDGHEGFLGDWTTPVKQALALMGGGDALARLEHLTAAALHEAAGLEFPAPPDIADAVHAADMVALATERRDVMLPSERAWAPLPMPHKRRTLILHPLDGERRWRAALDEALERGRG